MDSHQRKISFIRHAQQENSPDKNNKVLQLTSEGLAAAVNLGEQLRDVGFTYCVSSNAIRAQITTIEITSRHANRVRTRGYDELWIDLPDEGDNASFWKLLRAVGDQPLAAFDTRDEKGYLRQHADLAWDELKSLFLNEEHLLVVGHLPTLPALARKTAENFGASADLLAKLNLILMGKLDRIIITLNRDDEVISIEHIPYGAD